jgi:hypothetical protein
MQRCQCPQKAKNDRILSNFTKIETLVVKRDRHLGKRSLLQTEGKLGISSAMCWREYLEAGESQGHRFAITRSAAVAATGLKE